MRPAYLAVLALTACSSTPSGHYDWGHYETSVYDDGRTPRNISVDEDIRRLTDQHQKAVADGRPLPPGFLMHLGYLHSLNGETAIARRYFELEKAAYPESAHFINGIAERSRGRRP